MRDFAAEFRVISAEYENKMEALRKYLKENGRDRGMDWCSHSEEGMQIRRDFQTKWAMLRQDYREAEAHGDEYMIDGKIHNAKQKTE